jgi:hypothetical protein
MIVRSLDSDGDWTFGKGKQNYLSELSAVKQNVLTRLRSWKGNCFFDTESGVDWGNYLDIGTKTLLDLDIKRVILGTDKVLKISKFNSTLDTSEKKLTVAASVETYYGTITTEATI